MSKSRRSPVSTRRACKNATKTASDRAQARGRKGPASGAADLSREGLPLRERAASGRHLNIGLLTNGAGGGQFPRTAFRPALLAGVAAGALALAAPSPALAQTRVIVPGTVPDPCAYDADADSLNCDGDLSGGISITASTAADPVAAATIQNLTKAITPGIDGNGVLFLNSVAGDTTLKVDTGDYGIATTNGHGILASRGDDGDLTINSYGDITVSNGSGVDKFAIYGRQTSEGDVTIKSVGDLSVSKFHGLHAYSKYDAASVDSTGDIAAGEDGIYVKSYYGVATAVSNGNITALTGIRASTRKSVDPLAEETVVSVKSTGDITVTGATSSEYGYGVYAKSQISGDVYIYSKGDITSDSGDGYTYGIHVRAGTSVDGTNGTAYGDIEIISKGDIDVTRYGIDAVARVQEGSSPGALGAVSGDIDITSEGDVSAEFGVGIYAYAQGGDVTINSAGVVRSASGGGISGTSKGVGGVTRIYSEGNLYVDSRAIHAHADGAATVESNGAIEAGGDGIYARSGGGITVASRGDIDAGGSAIDAVSETGDVSVKSYGVLQAAGEGNFGIRAYTDSDADTYVTEVYIKSVGPVTAADWAGTGIFAALGNSSGGDDEVRVVSDGAVTAGGTAISAHVFEGDGDVFVNSNGDISAATGYANFPSNHPGAYGIHATAGDGDVSVISNGDVSSLYSYAIVAHSENGNVSVASTGDVTAYDAAINAAGEDVTVYAKGVIKTTGDVAPSPLSAHGISVDANGEADVDFFGTITATGDSSAAGIKVEGGGGDGINIYSRGAVTGSSAGISADTHGKYADIVIDSVGAVTGLNESNGYGIEVRSSNVSGQPNGYGNITITSEGDVSGDRAGVYAYSWHGDVSVDSDGTLTGGRGIDGYSYFGDVTVKSVGAVNAKTTGIRARARHGFMAYQGAVSVISNGAITVSGEVVFSDGVHGILATAPGGAYVNSTGAITVRGASSIGIKAHSENNDVKIISDGAVSASKTGIDASTGQGVTAVYNAIIGGDVMIDSTGAVAGATGYGIRAHARDGDVNVASEGSVTGGIVAIFAYVEDYAEETGDITIDSIGDLTATGSATNPNTTTVAGVNARSTTGAVSIQSNGAVKVSGDDARGVLASGVGRVAVNSAGAITANGASSIGIDANSTQGDVEIVSNGAVSAGETGIEASLGTGNGGNVVINSVGAVSGLAGYGIRARAGTGGVKITSDGAVSGVVVAISANNSGAEGSDGVVEVNSSGDLTGAEAGILAESQYSDVSVISEGTVKASSDEGRGIGASSDDGDVSIDADGPVTASGAQSIGIYGGSYLGDVTVNSAGDVMATGADSDGVRVVSGSDDSSNVVTISKGSVVTGGSGAGAGVRFNGGGTNRLENSGTITALSGVAVVASGDGAKEIVNTGTIVGSVTLGAGNDRVEISGESDVSGASFDGGEGADVFRLAATSDGAFADGSLRNFEVFEKAGSGVWSLSGEHRFTTSADILGGVLDLREATLSSTVVANSGGSLAVGGLGAVGTGTIDGDYVQEAGGDLLVDLDLKAGKSDLLTVSGSASLAGTVTPASVNAASNEMAFTILTAEGGVTDNGLTLNDFASPLISAELIFPNANDVAIAVSVAFAPPEVALSDDQTAIAGNLEAVFNAGGGVDGPFSDLFDALFFNLDDEAAYIDALNQLSPEVFLSTQTAGFYLAEGFSDELFSCADKTDASTLSREGQCFWLRGDAGLLDVDSGGGTIGFEEETAGVSIGWQVEVVDNWQIGIGGGFEKATIDTDAGARSEGDRYMGGVSIKHQRGPLRLAAAVSGGVAEYETTRRVSFGGFSDTVRSTQDVTHAAAEFRLAYRFDFGGWYAQPFVNGAATWIDLDDATEEGGAAALAIEGRDQTFLSVTPGVELGAEFALNDSFALKPFLRAGAGFVDNPELALDAGFVEAPAGAGAFVESVAIDDFYADVEAGVTLFKLGGGSKRGGRFFGDLGSRAAISFVYEGRINENTRQNGAFIKAALPF